MTIATASPAEAVQSISNAARFVPPSAVRTAILVDRSASPAFIEFEIFLTTP
jgi:hypothetical protein